MRYKQTFHYCQDQVTIKPTIANKLKDMHTVLDLNIRNIIQLRFYIKYISLVVLIEQIREFLYKIMTIFNISLILLIVVCRFPIEYNERIAF